MDEKVKELNLLLIYLTGWEEEAKNQPGEKIFRAWKGYLFEVLNDLEASKLIRQFGKSQAIILTDEGKRRAMEIHKKYFS